MGKDSLRDESYMKVGLTNILRRFGNMDIIEDSVSLLDSIYPCGMIGAPEDADI